MKTFTCKEMGGLCDATIEGETIEEVAKKGGEHIMAMENTNEAHKKICDDMKVQGEEGKTKWMEWFRGVWDQKD